jgi:hypothetical protein
MANTELQQRIATQVEDLVTKYPTAVEQFREQIRVFNTHWQKYRQFGEVLLLNRENRPPLQRPARTAKAKADLW